MKTWIKTGALVGTVLASMGTAHAQTEADNSWWDQLNLTITPRFAIATGDIPGVESIFDAVGPDFTASTTSSSVDEVPLYGATVSFSIPGLGGDNLSFTYYEGTMNWHHSNTFFQRATNSPIFASAAVSSERWERKDYEVIYQRPFSSLVFLAAGIRYEDLPNDFSLDQLLTCSSAGTTCGYRTVFDQKPYFVFPAPISAKGELSILSARVGLRGVIPLTDRTEKSWFRPSLFAEAYGAYAQRRAKSTQVVAISTTQLVERIVPEIKEHVPGADLTVGLVFDIGDHLLLDLRARARHFFEGGSTGAATATFFSTGLGYRF